MEIGVAPGAIRQVAMEPRHRFAEEDLVADPHSRHGQCSLTKNQSGRVGTWTLALSQRARRSIWGGWLAWMQPFSSRGTRPQRRSTPVQHERALDQHQALSRGLRCPDVDPPVVRAGPKGSSIA